MELLESLLADKKKLKVLIAVYVLVVIAVLLWIWWPEKVIEEARFEPYNESEKDKEMLEYYLEYLESLRYYGSQYFEKYIDYGYLQYTNTTLEEAAIMLKSTDNTYEINKFSKYKNGDSNIYSVVIPRGNEDLKLNIVENKYPYDFYITYGTFVSISDFPIYGSLEGARLKITRTYKDLNFIEYELSVTNNAYDNLTFDFSDAYNFNLQLESGEVVRLNLVQSEQDRVVIAKNETKVLNLVFNIGIDNQSEIKTLNIDKISNGSSKFTATISF